MPWYELQRQQDRDAIEVDAIQRRGENPFQIERADGSQDPKAFMRSLLREGLGHALRDDIHVLRAFMRVLNLLDPPQDLMSEPEIFQAVLNAWNERHTRPPLATGPSRAARCSSAPESACRSIEHPPSFGPTSGKQKPRLLFSSISGSRRVKDPQEGFRMKLRMRVLAAVVSASALMATGCGTLTIRSWIKVIEDQSSGSLSSDVLGGMPIPLSRLQGGFLGAIALDTRTLPGPIDGTVNVDIVRITADSAPSIIGAHLHLGEPGGGVERNRAPRHPRRDRLHHHHSEPEGDGRALRHARDSAGRALAGGDLPAERRRAHAAPERRVDGLG